MIDNVTQIIKEGPHTGGLNAEAGNHVATNNDSRELGAILDQLNQFIKHPNPKMLSSLISNLLMNVNTMTNDTMAAAIKKELLEFEVLCAKRLLSPTQMTNILNDIKACIENIEKRASNRLAKAKKSTKKAKKANDKKQAKKCNAQGNQVAGGSQPGASGVGASTGSGGFSAKG